MKYYLIKSINCIVSDAQPVKGYYYDSFIKAIRNTSKAEYEVSDHCHQIEYSNNKIEVLKPFELIDEEEREIRDALGMTYDAQINGQPKFKKMFQDDMIESLKTIREFNYKNGYPTKAKAGYTEEQTTGFTEWVTLNYRVHDRLDGILYYFPIVTEKFKHQMFSAKELLTLYLKEQDSKLIEVIQISESVFKIKKS